MHEANRVAMGCSKHRMRQISFESLFKNSIEERAGRSYADVYVWKCFTCGIMHRMETKNIE